MSESGFVQVDGGRLYYEVEGDGHPLLLIHGGLGTLRMWDQQVPVFAEHYRVIRFDTRGWGRTETEEVDYSDADDAVTVLEFVGASSAFVVGQSRGGGIALDLVLSHPERADALVSVAGGIGGYETPGEDAGPWSEMERLWEAKDWEALADLETRVWVDGWGQPPTRIDPDLRSTVQQWILAGYQEEKVDGKPRALDPPAAHRLAEVRIPTLAMVGEFDEKSEAAVGRHLAASVDGAELIEFAGVAHMIHLEEPERFNALTLEFLARADRERSKA